MCVTENRVFLAQVNHDLSLVYFYRPDCHLWSCLDCAEVNKRRWTAIVGEGIKHYQEEGFRTWRFVTLTSSGKLSTFNQTLYVWRPAWRKLYARLKRKQPDIKYVFLPEKHADGRLHFHALVSADLGTRWWKDNAYTSGLGYKAESQEPLSLISACSYVLKYITKSLQCGSAWPKHFHRIRVSHGWPKADLALTYGNLLDGCTVIHALEWSGKAALWRSEGYKLIDIRTGEIQ